jgi:N-acetylglucosaminyl-diphospho-decaprenol L-rhamnosyltransferase
VTTLSIIIVSYNARKHLEDCLESITATPPSTPHDIIVVDNASPDDSVATVRRRWPHVRVIEQTTNVGFAAANNIGIRATRSELILLLNNDTVVPAGAIDALVVRLLARPDVAIAGPRLSDRDGRPELSFGRMISPFNELRQRTTLALYRRRVGWISRWIEQETDREQLVDWVSGACLLVRRADAEAVGLLDERYFLYTEDVDFCAAIRARGRHVLFSPAAHILHLGGRSRATVPAASSRAYRRSQIAFYEKHHPAWTPLLTAYLRLKGEFPK